MKITNHRKGGQELWCWTTAGEASSSIKWRWANFSAYEMACKRNGIVVISPAFMDEVQLLRERTQVVMPVSSGYRSPDHNANVSHTRSTTGPHPDAQAVDIRVGYNDAYLIMQEAFKQGFRGIGVKQHGDSRYLHLDMWWYRETGVVWTYFEK